MRIAKVEDGLLEQDDYLLTTRTTEFLGDHIFSRSNDVLSLMNGYLERNLNHEEFVIMVDKYPDVLDINSKFSVYTRKDSRRSGIEEFYNDSEASATNWKIIQYNGYIQTYMSYDNKESWIACGGGQIREYSNVQGFSIEGVTPLRLKKYALYRNPYARIYDVGLGCKVEIVDENNNILDSKVSDTGDVSFFLDDVVTGKFVFYDPLNRKIHETPMMEIKLGDSYINILFDIDLYYGNLIEKYATTKLNKLNDIMQIKNNSITDTYEDINISIVNKNTDAITISLDDINYSTSLTIEQLLPEESKNIYISITKDTTLPHFGRRSFVLEID